MAKYQKNNKIFAARIINRGLAPQKITKWQQKLDYNDTVKKENLTTI